jgi:hypothetical protein
MIRTLKLTFLIVVLTALTQLLLRYDSRKTASVNLNENDIEADSEDLVPNLPNKSDDKVVIGTSREVPSVEQDV